jgi:DNA excision repair protein ERCC-4
MYPRIVVDKRERGSKIPKLLRQAGINVDLATLIVGDYIISSNIAIERKTIIDYIRSLYDGRLYIQCAQLYRHFSCPLLILEGDFNDLRDLSVRLNDYYRSIAIIIIDFKISIVHTSTIEDTKELLKALAIKSQDNSIKGPLLRKMRKEKSEYNQQLSILSSLPGIGDKLATRMLDKFISPKNALNASVAELAKIPGLGVSRAQRVRKILDDKYTLKDEVNQETLLGHMK